MNILQLCNKAPYPAKDGGAIAMLSLAKSFADLGHEVTILAMNTTKHFLFTDDIPEELKRSIDFHLVSVDTKIRALSLIRNLLLSRKPYIAERFVNPLFEQKLVDLLHKKHFDIIQLEGLYLLPYIPVIRNNCSSTISLRAHNIESEIWSRIKMVTTNPLKKYYFGVISKRLGEFEIKTLNTYDLLVPITERDAATFKGLGNSKPTKVIPAGISEMSFHHNISSSESRKKLFFIGALDWIPNQEGLIWFLDNVWKPLSKEIPEIEFHIAGRNAPDWLEKRCTGKGLNYLGEVEDAHLFMDSNDIMVIPLFAGSGMRIKIVEAMARSKVVVTTTIGAEGLGIENEKQLIVGNSADEFVNGITRLVKESDFFGKIQENAFVYTQQKFNNNKLTIELVEFYKNQLSC